MGNIRIVFGNSSVEITGIKRIIVLPELLGRTIKNAEKKNKGGNFLHYPQM
jgi:hypothetical protein